MLRKLILPAALTIIGAAHPASAQAPDPNLGRNLAAGCANCHGTNGNSLGGPATLAGESKDSIVRKMKDFSSGKTPATVMHQIAKGYTDAQVEALAAYFSAQKPAASGGKS
jgi:cytochrome subunit of sulfide dehydrogenase